MFHYFVVPSMCPISFRLDGLQLSPNTSSHAPLVLAGGLPCLLALADPRYLRPLVEGAAAGVTSGVTSNTVSGAALGLGQTRGAGAGSVLDATREGIVRGHALAVLRDLADNPDAQLPLVEEVVAHGTYTYTQTHTYTHTDACVLFPSENPRGPTDSLIEVGRSATHENHTGSPLLIQIPVDTSFLLNTGWPGDVAGRGETAGRVVTGGGTKRRDAARSDRV